MLKTTRLSDLTPKLGVNNEEVGGGDGKADDKNLSKKPKNTKYGIQMRIGAIEEPIFLTPGAKKAFNQLR